MSELPQTKHDPVANKPRKPRPIFYAHVYQQLQEIGREHGYNLLIHGSMNRDMDLVAVPWVNDPKPHLELLQQIEKHLNGVYHTEISEYLFTMLPGGRSSYVINLNRGGRFNGYVDEQYYLDISITPFINTQQ